MATTSSPAWDAEGEADRLVARLVTTKKYRHIHPATLRDVAVLEAAHVRDARALDRQVRQRLHRAVAQFLAPGGSGRLISQIEGLPTTLTDPELRAWCRDAMRHHASSAERVDELEDLYPCILDLIGPVTSIADLACAYNPLSLPWLRDSSDAAYVGYDFNAQHVEFGRRFAAHVDPVLKLVHADVIVDPGVVVEPVSLLLKTFHCLESRRKGSGLGLIEALGSRIVVVSLPTQSLGGRGYGFAAGHGASIERRAAQEGWTITTGSLRSEEFWAIDKAPVP